MTRPARDSWRKLVADLEKLSGKAKTVKLKPWELAFRWDCEVERLSYDNREDRLLFQRAFEAGVNSVRRDPLARQKEAVVKVAENWLKHVKIYHDPALLAVDDAVRSLQAARQSTRRHKV